MSGHAEPLPHPEGLTVSPDMSGRETAKQARKRRAYEKRAKRALVVTRASQARFLKAVAKHASITKSCEVAKVSRSQVYVWQADDAAFAERMEAAHAEAIDGLYGEFFARGKEYSDAGALAILRRFHPAFKEAPKPLPPATGDGQVPPLEIGQGAAVRVTEVSHKTTTLEHLGKLSDKEFDELGRLLLKAGAQPSKVPQSVLNAIPASESLPTTEPEDE